MPVAALMRLVNCDRLMHISTANSSMLSRCFSKFCSYNSETFARKARVLGSVLLGIGVEDEEMEDTGVPSSNASLPDDKDMVSPRDAERSSCVFCFLPHLRPSMIPMAAAMASSTSRDQARE